MKRRRVGEVPLWCVAGVLQVAASACGEPDGVRNETRVLVVVCDTPQSRMVGEHYARARGIPATRILCVDIPAVAEVGYEEYRDHLERPVRAAVDACPGIEYVVLCFGVPYRIRETEPAPERDERLLASHRYEEYVETHDWASTDSELACARLRVPSRNGWIRNPLYGKTGAVDSLVLKVCRIDGPSARAACALVDRALAAERAGIPRRAMIDVHPPIAAGSGYRCRDQRMESAGKLLEDHGFAVRWERTSGTELRPKCWGQPSVYIGWYAPCPLMDVAARGVASIFPPGAFGMHVHSFAAANLRSERENWVGPLVVLGITGAVGTVAEPMTEGYPAEDLLVQGLLSGRAFGDVVYAALPRLSWVTVVIGDPLWRPQYAT